MIINQDFREFIQLLNDNNVRYLVIGGYAVAFHGHPRYTKDMDLWIWRDKANAENLIKALKDFGFGSLDLKAEDFLELDQVVQLGYPPNRIDLLTEIEGVDFETCYSSKVKLNVEGTIIYFIDLNNLKNKKELLEDIKI